MRGEFVPLSIARKGGELLAWRTWLVRERNTARRKQGLGYLRPVGVGAGEQEYMCMVGCWVALWNGRAVEG